MFITFVRIALLISVLKIISAQKLEHILEKRFTPPLIFLPTAPTRIQLILGIGIPEEDLLFESLTNGWVFKYEYFLPSNATQLYVPDRTQIVGRSIPDKVKENVEIVNSPSVFREKCTTSYVGNPFCELNEVSEDFEYMSEIRKKKQKLLSKYRWAIYKALEAAMDRGGQYGRICVLKSICEASKHRFDYQNGIFADLVHIILTPSSSVDELSSHSDNEYFQAEFLGKSGVPCHSTFKNCKRSLLDMYTNVV